MSSHFFHVLHQNMICCSVWNLPFQTKLTKNMKIFHCEGNSQEMLKLVYEYSTFPGKVFAGEKVMLLEFNLDCFAQRHSQMIDRGNHIYQEKLKIMYAQLWTLQESLKCFERLLLWSKYMNQPKQSMWLDRLETIEKVLLDMVEVRKD